MLVPPIAHFILSLSVKHQDRFPRKDLMLLKARALGYVLGTPCLINCKANRQSKTFRKRSGIGRVYPLLEVELHPRAGDFDDVAVVQFRATRADGDAIQS